MIVRDHHPRGGTRTIDASGGDLDQHFALLEHRHGTVAQLQDFRTAGGGDFNGAHDVPFSIRKRSIVMRMADLNCGRLRQEPEFACGETKPVAIHLP